MIYLIFVLIFDFILFMIIPYSFLHLTYFTPMIFVSSIPILYCIFSKKNFFLILLIVGILFDIFYSFVIFLNVLVFLLIGILVMFINSKKNIYKLILSFILCIFSYDFFLFLIFNFLGNFITMDIFLYKFSHSLILNLLFFVISVVVFKSRIFGDNKKLKF